MIAILLWAGIGLGTVVFPCIIGYVCMPHSNARATGYTRVMVPRRRRNRSPRQTTSSLA